MPRIYKTHFETLVLNDLAVFEEKRLQDLLICRAQAPSHSVKVVENDLLGVWDERLSELLDRREGYLQVGGPHITAQFGFVCKMKQKIYLYTVKLIVLYHVLRK